MNLIHFLKQLIIFLNSTFLNHDLSKVKYDIENMISRKLILKTWAQQIKDLEKENSQQ